MTRSRPTADTSRRVTAKVRLTWRARRYFVSRQDRLPSAWASVSGCWSWPGLCVSSLSGGPPAVAGGFGPETPGVMLRVFAFLCLWRLWCRPGLCSWGQWPGVRALQQEKKANLKRDPDILATPFSNSCHIPMTQPTSIFYLTQSSTVQLMQDFACKPKTNWK